jgi:hypothetical protein
LGGVDGHELVDRFSFEEDFVFDDEIGAEAAVEGEVFVADGDFFLGDDCKVFVGEFKGEAFLVDRLEEAGAQFTMDGDGRADDGLG